MPMETAGRRLERVERIIRVDVDSADLDTALEKAGRLKELLGETEQLLKDISIGDAKINREEKAEMFLTPGDFLKLWNGNLLEVVFADSEKAVCLRLKKCSGIGMTHTGAYIVVSNKPNYYVDELDFERVPSVDVMGRYHWEPLDRKSLFFMV